MLRGSASSASAILSGLAGADALKRPSGRIVGASGVRESPLLGITASGGDFPETEEGQTTLKQINRSTGIL